MLQLTIAPGIATRGFPTVAAISVWPVLIFLAWLGVMYLTYRYRGLPRWTPTKMDDVPLEQDAEHRRSGTPEWQSDADESMNHNPSEAQKDRRSQKSLWLLFSGFSLVVLVARDGSSPNQPTCSPHRPAWAPRSLARRC